MQSQRELTVVIPIFTIMDVKFTSWKSNFTDLSSNEEVVLNDLGMINLTIGMEVFIDSSVFEIPKQSSFTIFGFIEPISCHDGPVSIINSNRDNSFHVVSADKLKISKDPKNLQEVVKERFSGFIQWLQHISESKLTFSDFFLPLKKVVDKKSLPPPATEPVRKSARKASLKAKDTIHQYLSPHTSP